MPERIVHNAIYTHMSPYLSEWQQGLDKGKLCVCGFLKNVVRGLLLPRVTKQSRKGILLFSSIFLVNCMSAFCLLRCS